MDEKVIVLIGDLINSRKIPDRIDFDRELLHTLDLRSAENPAILSNYTLIGDEIQAVYSSASGIFTDATIIMDAIYPQKMRFSFGISHLIKPINQEQTIAMDGPAFYLARDGVNALKSKSRLFSVISENEAQTALYNAVLDLVSLELAKWNQKKLSVFSRYMQGSRPIDIIDQLGIPKSTVYDMINEGSFEEYKTVFSGIENLINEGI